MPNHLIFNERPECQDRVISFLQKWGTHMFHEVKRNKNEAACLK